MDRWGVDGIEGFADDATERQARAKNHLKSKYYTTIQAGLQCDYREQFHRQTIDLIL